MKLSDQFVTASEAARKLGISTKALRVYETRGLIAPTRTAAGWRTYGPDEMSRAADIVALRALDLSLGQIREVLDGDPRALADALAAHQTVLEDRSAELDRKIQTIRKLRAELVDGDVPTSAHVASILSPVAFDTVSFELPWPWAGELFTFTPSHRLTFITGPLASGKTRLARAIAQAHSDAAYLGLDRCIDCVVPVAQDPYQAARIDSALAWLRGEGATVVPDLVALVTALETAVPCVLVIDLVEQGLDECTQAALISYLRRCWKHPRSLYVMTRSIMILDLEDDATVEDVLYCPPNHSPPMTVRPVSGSLGFESVSNCLAAPDVRARSAGVVAIQTDVA